MAREVERVESRWARDEQDLARFHPGLQLARSGLDQARIEGSLAVPLPSGRLVEYQIVIEYPGLDPLALPDTYDSTGCFQGSGENHVEPDGRFCMWLPQTAPVKEFAKSGGLLYYLRAIQEFIVLQLTYQSRRKHGIEPAWPGKEWSHGSLGHEQWFQATTKGLTFGQLNALLDAAKHRYRPDSRCPCGSGQPVKRCHQRWLAKLGYAIGRDPRVLKIGYAFAQSLKVMPQNRRDTRR